MLALRRRTGERLIFSKDGKEIGRIKVVAIEGGKVLLSLDFGPEMQIDREELAVVKRIHMNPKPEI